MLVCPFIARKLMQINYLIPRTEKTVKLVRGAPNHLDSTRNVCLQEVRWACRIYLRDSGMRSYRTCDANSIYQYPTT